MMMLNSVIAEDGTVNMGLLEKYMEQIPEKALQIGIKVLLALIIFWIGMKLIKWLRKIMRKALVRGNADVGVIQFLDSLTKFGLSALLIFAIATQFGLETTSVITVLGSAGIAIGLAVQGSLSNFAGGVLILLIKPFKVGDYIKEDTNKNEGTVTEISLFYTKLTTYDGMVIVLPNGTLANTSLTNVTGCDTRKIDIKVSISYHADIKQARQVILALLDNDKKVLQHEEKRVYVHDLADSGVIIGVRCYAKNQDYWEMKWKLMEEIKETLDKNHIEIPYPQMDVHVSKV